MSQETSEQNGEAPFESPFPLIDKMNEILYLLLSTRDIPGPVTPEIEANNQDLLAQFKKFQAQISPMIKEEAAKMNLEQVQEQAEQLNQEELKKKDEEIKALNDKVLELGIQEQSAKYNVVLVREMSQKCKTYEKLIEKQSEEIEELKGIYDFQVQNNDDLKEESARIEKTIGELEQEMKDNFEKYQEERKITTVQKKKISILLEEKESLEGYLKESKKKVQNVVKWNEDKEQNYKDQIVSLNNDVQEGKNALTNFQEMLSIVQDQLENDKNQLQTAENKIEKLKEENQKLQYQLESKQQEALKTEGEPAPKKDVEELKAKLKSDFDQDPKNSIKPEDLPSTTAPGQDYVSPYAQIIRQEEQKLNEEDKNKVTALESFLEQQLKMKDEMADQNDDDDEKDKQVIDEMTELVQIVASAKIAPVASTSIGQEPDIDELD